jgi:hypothetical protein
MTGKILFWVDSDELSFCLAYYLKKIQNYDFFALINTVDTPKKFHQTQKLVDFNQTWYYDDFVKHSNSFDLNYLKKFEEQYHIDLWTLAINERQFYKYNRYHAFSRDEILSILSQECKLFEEILDECKPDFLITKETALHDNHLLYELCRKKGIKVLMWNPSKLSGRLEISEQLNHIDNMPSLESIQSQNRSLSDLKNYLKTLGMSKQIKNYVTKHSNSKIQFLNAILKFIFLNNVSQKNFNYVGRSKFRVLSKEFILLLKDKYRKNFIDRNLLKIHTDDSPFVLLPLHQEPERSLLIASPFNTNQIETIRHIAKSLPINYKLFVKEHYAQSLRNWREISEYKEILEIPNVFLIHPSISMEKLIENSSLVISVGGTASFEAAFFGKPSIVFVDMGFSFLSSVFKLNSLEELRKTIIQALKIEVDVVELDKYVTILEKNSFEFDIFEFGLLSSNAFRHGGNLANSEISISQMELFLKNNKSILEKLAYEYNKKIKSFTS